MSFLKKKKPVSEEKAKEILRHGSVHGEPLTKKQKGFFGVLASVKIPSRVKKS